MFSFSMHKRITITCPGRKCKAQFNILHLSGGTVNVSPFIPFWSFSTVLVSFWGLQEDAHLHFDASPRRAPTFTHTRLNSTSNCWLIWNFFFIEREARTWHRWQVAAPPCLQLWLSLRYIRRPIPPFHPVVNSFRFFIIVGLLVLITTYSSCSTTVVLYKLYSLH